MAASTHDVKYLMTKPGVMAHPNLITPKAFKAGAKPQYSVSFVLDQDHPDVAPLKAAILQAAKAKWPGKDIAAEVKSGALKVPFTQGDKQIERRKKKLADAGKEYKGDADFQSGKILFKASSEFPTALGVRVKGQGDIDVTDENKALHKNAFYFGANALGGFTLRPYDGVGEDGKPGVKMYLDLVHSFNTGKKLTSGQKSATEAFKGVAGAVVDEDPTAGGDMPADDGEGEAF